MKRFNFIKILEFLTVLLCFAVFTFFIHSRNIAENELKVPVSTPEKAHKETISLSAMGDILMHNTVIWSGQKAQGYNYDHLFAPMQNLLSGSDYTSVCLEAALAGPETGYTGYPLFNSPDQLAYALKNSGFDLIVTANNHCLDRGYKGAARTLQVLHEAGLDTIGTYISQEDSKQVFIRNIRGVKVGYLSYSYDTNGIPVPKDHPYFIRMISQDGILKDIAELRPDVDVLILVLHWGVEYSPYPTEVQRQLAKSFLESGADAILGSHPHVIQAAETMQINGKKKFVIYSMGNAVGNQRGMERNSGTFVQLEFTKDFVSGETKLAKVNMIPTFSHEYMQNGRKMFRVIPVEETIASIKSGTEPVMNSGNIQQLDTVLKAAQEQLNSLN